MSVTNRIVFQATGKPFEIGDWVKYDYGAFDRCNSQYMANLWNERDWTAYRRIDAPADSRLLEVATALAAGTCASSPDAIFEPESVTTAAVTLARALIAACEGAAQ